MYSAKIIEDNFNVVTEDRLTTFEITYPRFVHSELLTHRMFSRNSASSRAIPNHKLRERIQNDPVLPVHWGKNQSGMQANEILEPEIITEAEKVWLEGRNAALKYSEQLGKLGVHKQICNRLIEPWMFITVILTATDFLNYFYLRTPQIPEGENEFLDKNFYLPDFPAQPEIQKIARMMWLAYNKSNYKKVEPGYWHLPYITKEERDNFSIPTENLVKISTGRCARVSYLTHDGKRDLEADCNLHDRLAESGHWSPFEHPAMALDRKSRSGNFVGWGQYRKTFIGENMEILEEA